MIKSVEFVNFRNLNGKYTFKTVLNVFFGKNNMGKTNVLEGIKLAFSTITNDFFKINKSDFRDSDDSNPIEIKVELKDNSIPSLNYIDSSGKTRCGFKVLIKKTQSGRYSKEITHYNGSNIDFDILRDDCKIPNVYMIPLLRIEDIYTNNLTTGISKFIDSESKYHELKKDSRNAIKKEMNTKIEKFKSLCKKFDQNLDIEVSEPKFSDEKVYIINGDNADKEHNFKIGSGYKSIANIILNTMSEEYSIILIDEIENHIHPSLLRTLLRELENIENIIIIATTHSPIVINELQMDELLDISGKDLCNLSDKTKNKLNIFLHPGRSELMLADNIVLVEGYTEELILKNYLRSSNQNWTIINVAGIMFEPYIELALLLGKKLIVISDNDKALSEKKEISSRFSNLKTLCCEKNVCLLEVDNTLETDLYNNHYLDDCLELLTTHKNHNDIYVAKNNKKTEIAQRLIENKVDLSNWHVIRDLENEFKSN